ncbi:unnamed protein product [Kuraishia capsulata CBS 1993]|uniref:NAD-dependent epimerase/dehydratase domain-containing protein n=1 Tax=Kuraishia capsulata CBS 1993 TaxID=1382522 RepID=W6MX64_9ASCO|nr:uncharacterized protein KUCA_T00004327001 [Kuraishia capsulata CBS 1993]CDK28345.1 unnamed protein product [Kuraishia capsulata CBS 1993]
MPTVLVTGASGYIAAHIVSQLLEKEYTVIGTVRSEEKAEFFLKKFSDSDLSFEIVADIAEAASFDATFKAHPEIEFVIHSAAVLPRGVPKEDFYKQYVETSIAGTTNILKAIEKYGPKVKHVVLTSSGASIADFRLLSDPDLFLTEETWNEMTWDQVGDYELLAYAYSKAEAERAALKFVERPEIKFTFTSVCPFHVIGPQKFVELEGNPSSEVQHVISLVETPADNPGPFDAWGVAIDVRDVAKAHVLSVENYVKFKGARLALGRTEFSSQIFLDFINKNFPELVGKIPVGNSADHAATLEAKHVAHDFTKTAEIMGIDFIPLEKSVVDGVRQYLEYKDLKK